MHLSDRYSHYCKKSVRVLDQLEVLDNKRSINIPASFTSSYVRLTLTGICDNGTQVRAEGPTILRNCVGDSRPSTMLYGKVQ